MNNVTTADGISKKSHFLKSLSDSTNLTFICLEMAACIELLFKRMSDNIFHILEFTFEIFELLVVVVDSFLVVNIFIL